MRGVDDTALSAARRSNLCCHRASLLSQLTTRLSSKTISIEKSYKKAERDL